MKSVLGQLNKCEVSDVERAADILFNYLRDVIYSPVTAALDVEDLPAEFRELGSGLRFFAECVIEAKGVAAALAKGDLAVKMPSSDNEIAAPLKSLHASLRHLTWQTQQVAKGDYQQRVIFMGEFAAAFNTMVQQLEARRVQNVEEKSKLQRYIDLILTNTPNIQLVFDAEGKAVLASETYMRIRKISSEDEIRGKHFTELFAPFARDGFMESIGGLIGDAMMNNTEAKTEQSIDFGSDGCFRTYIVHVTPMRSEDEAMLGTMVIFDDMTEVIEARHEAERARELAEQSTRAKSEFLARMTHEMRTPMNAIIGMTTIGKSAQSVEKKDYSFQKIEDASTHLLGVINDILDMSKIEADKLELSYSEFDFENMLDNVMNIINFRAADKRQNLSVEISEGIPSVIVSDEQRLAQVVTNLLSNAVKFTPENGSIELSAKKVADAGDDCTIRFTVKDTGIGISEEQQENLFAPFEQANGSISRKFGGTGLGLSISKRIVEMMDGSIWVESTLGEGASFIFDVKVQKSAVTHIDEETAESAEKENGTLEGQHILIAEDVDINREIIATLLEDTGVMIDFAVSGAEAVGKVTSQPDKYGLILMDIQMPEMDGYEATRTIRACGIHPAENIPIIAMTANVFREDIERCLEAGMNDHLGKPVDLCEIIAKLKKYLL